MIAFLDTNVLVRHLTGDPRKLAARATRFLAEAEEGIDGCQTFGRDDRWHPHKKATRARAHAERRREVPDEEGQQPVRPSCVPRSE
ncbi:MAG: hypothetical protein M3357_17400, partial [Actinomycetota bacterium]|nr:hypothetical protein [Actinomycetota bacterium]